MIPTGNIPPRFLTSMSPPHVVDPERRIMEKRIGTITIIITDRNRQAQKVNAILCDFGDMIIGRMGLPHAQSGLHIIALIVHATTDEIGALTGKLGALPGVSVKSSLTKI
jgi:putative iron-only hydrogenase system regulator